MEKFLIPLFNEVRREQIHITSPLVPQTSSFAVPVTAQKLKRYNRLHWQRFFFLILFIAQKMGEIRRGTNNKIVPLSNLLELSLAGRVMVKVPY